LCGKEELSIETNAIAQNNGLLRVRQARVRRADSSAGSGVPTNSNWEARVRVPQRKRKEVDSKVGKSGIVSWGVINKFRQKVNPDDKTTTTSEYRSFVPFPLLIHYLIIITSAVPLAVAGVGS